MSVPEMPAWELPFILPLGTAAALYLLDLLAATRDVGEPRTRRTTATVVLLLAAYATVAEERARIARDLHDSAGHAVNVIAVRAGEARLRHDPERSQTTLEMIEELARPTAAEIDEIVGALRDAGCADEANPARVIAAPWNGLPTRKADAEQPSRLEWQPWPTACRPVHAAHRVGIATS